MGSRRIVVAANAAGQVKKHIGMSSAAFALAPRCEGIGRLAVMRFRCAFTRAFSPQCAPARIGLKGFGTRFRGGIFQVPSTGKLIRKMGFQGVDFDFCRYLESAHLRNWGR